MQMQRDEEKGSYIVRINERSVEIKAAWPAHM